MTGMFDRLRQLMARPRAPDDALAGRRAAMRAARDQGDMGGAWRLSAALVGDPGATAADWNFHGALAFGAGDTANALAAWRQALILDPGNGLAHANLAQALHEAGDAACVTHYEAALADKWVLDDALALARWFISAKELAAARVLLTEAAGRLEPGRHSPALRAQTGQLLVQSGGFETAATLLNQLAAEQALDAESYGFLSIAQERNQRILACWQAASAGLALDPKNQLCLHYGGIAALRLCRFDEAIKWNARLVALKNTPAVRTSELFVLSYDPNLTAEEIFSHFAKFGRDFGTGRPAPRPSNPDPGRRLRVGYVSGDYRRHSSMYLFAPLFLGHDPDSVEIIAYSNVFEADEFTPRFMRMFSQWRDISALPAEQAAELVLNDRIDVLVDLTGQMADHRLDLFALRPAPVQVTWLGSAWTTGLKEIDAAFHCPATAPEGSDHLWTEGRVWRLPATMFIYEPPPAAPPVSPLPAARNGFVTFGYSGRTERLNDQVLTAWADILRRLPDARLVLDFHTYKDPPTDAYFRQRFVAAGLDNSRVITQFTQPVANFYPQIDILLDPFPHSGGTILLEASWGAVPTVTLASRPPVGRFAAMVMENLGLADWIAEDVSEYVENAVAFGSDIDGLGAIRASLRARMAESPLTDGKSFAAAFEDAYRTLWREACSRSIVS